MNPEIHTINLQRHEHNILLSLTYTPAVHFTEIENAFKNTSAYIMCLIQFLALPQGSALYSTLDVRFIKQLLNVIT